MKAHLIPLSSLALAAATLNTSAQTILMDSTTNNGSFETIDPHTAPISSATRRASNSGTAFFVGGTSLVQGAWEITGGGFHGIDTTGAANGGGPHDGTELALANDGATTNLLSGAIPVFVEIGDTFDLSAWTMGNNDNGVFDYTFTLRFDGDSANDVVLSSGTHTSTAVEWYERSATGIVSPVAASSVQLLVTMSNPYSDPVTDQVYVDNITLTTSATGLDPAGDEDSDGLSNGDEQSGILNPYNSLGVFVGVGNGGAPTSPVEQDSDFDGIYDDEEISGALNPFDEFGALVAPDPGEPTNPNSVDTDGDTLEDFDEVDELTGSDFLSSPTLEDTDFDDLPDAWEVNNLLDPNDDGTVDEDNGADGNPDGDDLTNEDELFYETDPQNPDTDGDTMNDGIEVFDNETDPLDPDTDHDGLDDGEEDALMTDPKSKDSDDDTFSDYAEVNFFNTDPNLDSSVPSPDVLIDVGTANGSFEDTDPSTAPITNDSGRHAINATGSFTLPSWTCTHLAGYVGFDAAQPAAEGSQYAFVNAGADAAYQSDPHTLAITPGRKFYIQLDSTTNRPDLSSNIVVSLVFDGDNENPVVVDTIVQDDVDTANVPDYFERSLSFIAPQSASTVALRIQFDNTGAGQDQPRFDNVRFYSEEGPPPAEDFGVTSIVRNGDDTISLTWLSEPGATYALLTNPDLSQAVSVWTIENGSISSGGTSTSYTSTATYADLKRFFVVRKNP